MKFLTGVKRLVEADGEKITATELMEFKRSCTEAEIEGFCKELSEIFGEPVTAA